MIGKAGVLARLFPMTSIRLTKLYKQVRTHVSTIAFFSQNDEANTVKKRMLRFVVGAKVHWLLEGVRPLTAHARILQRLGTMTRPTRLITLPEKVFNMLSFLSLENAWQLCWTCV